MDWLNLPSHSLVDHELYESTYKRIKEDFGRPLAQTWTERTDPQKYVFEDCGIASYLIGLRHSIPSLEVDNFADIGCGNGLLTYLLANCGLTGVGIDARSRKIWARFEDKATLLQASIDPSLKDGLPFPGSTKLLIGNHSDELTPWIPVMAARARCSFFLLPCCPHDFYSKFSSRPANQRHGGTGAGQYEQYLDYVYKLIQDLGFDVRIDKLKIASTKKVAFVATIPDSGLPENLEDVIVNYLNVAARYKQNFVPLAPKAEVRNCTQLPFLFKQALSKKIGLILTGGLKSSNEPWTNGKSLPLKTLVTELTNEEKENLKSQCGGLQTFIKNHHQPFEVRDGQVRMRNWPLEYVKFNKADKRKLSQCWFDILHCQGCPLTDNDCPFRHQNERIEVS